MIGFFGGSFNPVHFGHLEIGKKIKQRLNLDKLFLMPCSPVHKNDLFFNNEQRLTFLELAIKDYPMLEIDKREINNKHPTYTIDTLKKIKLDYPKQKIFFIMGADSYANIDTWKNYQQLRDYAQLVIISRPKTPISTPKNIIVFDGFEFDIASSLIIERIKNKQTIKQLVPTAVMLKIQTVV